MSLQFMLWRLRISSKIESQVRVLELSFLFSDGRSILATFENYQDF